VAGDYLYHCYNGDCAAPAQACGVIARHHYSDCFDVARHALRMSRGAYLEQALAGLESVHREFRLWLFEPGYPPCGSETTAGRELQGPAVISLRLSLYQFRSGT